MSIERDQMLMGYAIAIVCLIGLVFSRWFLNSTRKGRWLLIKFGRANGLWVLRAIFLAGVGAGICLALDVIRPL